MNARALLLVCLLPAMASAQGYAGLGTEADAGFAAVTPPAAFEFPRDHGAHPEFRIEWWYLTAVLTGADGAEYGAQWTLFRSALAPGEAEGWASPQIWMGHAGLTSATAHFHAERIARGGVGQAGVEAAPFAAWIDDWRMSGADLGALSLHASGDGFSYDLSVTAEGPIVPQGNGGFSVKSASGQASYYYSQPFYRASGSIEIGGETVEVTGRAWLDREWSSQPLAADQDGWDWVSLHLDTGEKLMAFALRATDGGRFRSGAWIAADGTPTPLEDGDIVMTPMARTEVAGREVPTAWRIEIPRFSLDVSATALNAESWMGVSFPYWEGPVGFSGSHAGRGYLEMTGYE